MTYLFLYTHFTNGKGWNGWRDFLGTKPVKWRPFEKAREFVRTLGLKNGKEWYEYSKSGKRPKDIPSAPRDSYKGKGWKGFGDWLGTGKTRRSTREYRPFEEAREFVRALGLKNDREWKEYCKSGKIPEDIAPQHAQLCLQRQRMERFGRLSGNWNYCAPKYRIQTV